MPSFQVFGVEEGWDEWKEGALKRYEGNKRLKALVAHNCRESKPGMACCFILKPCLVQRLLAILTHKSGKQVEGEGSVNIVGVARCSRW